MPPIENHCPKAIIGRHTMKETHTHTHQIVIAIKSVEEVKRNIKSKEINK